MQETKTATTQKQHTIGVTLNNASDYRTNGHYQTPNPSPLAR